MAPMPPPAWRKIPTLRGRHATLEPLHATHADALHAALGDGALSRLWYTNVPAPEGMEGYIAAALAARADGDALPFAVRDAAGEVVGTTRCYRLAPEVPTLCIGYTWYAPQAQRTGLNTEAKLMLLRHAFETLGCLSVVFETSWFNHASRAAIARLGAKQDGVLRRHKRHADGSPRDTVVFSIIDAEWQAVERHLRFHLDAHS
ncbi:GNAT family N-acetyltransferase [Xanthomonas theicola]|uniref:GNAT family N-acetyltransferase n=1 Tax=Xanthomonas theicola TaxID=56464 RepID=A0A2S6ZD33_9XANT|nr:GNAT family N-acetyltransferase [Xanthomonas theicola]PPT89212.1 GNAT family N-acetyltransferase [Xanthomonas theicola]QNH25366.1 GNAT family N-acetyltransferase [Xanthomonas theicola]